jgi:hypothetical protein
MTEYICECGFSCKKLHYFQNHKSICLLEVSNIFDVIISKLEKDDMEKMNQWWNKYSDRKFMQKLYPKIGNYLRKINLPKILDIGFEDYNIINKDLLNNPEVLYYQLEPFIENKRFKNDVLLEYKVTDLLVKNIEFINYFHIILDFGVLGAPSISKNWEKDEIIEYIKNIHSVLKDDGLYFLKIDLPYLEMPEYKIHFDKMIYPYFDPVTFEDYENGIHIFNENKRRPDFSRRDQYKFFFLKKKNNPA